VRKLEIGPGNSIMPGWDTLDCVDRPGITYLAKWGEDRLPIEDGTYNEVRSSHSLEHIPWYRTVDALLEVYRVLKPSGVFCVFVPDFARLCEDYLARRCGDRWGKFGAKGNPMLWFIGRTLGYGPEYNWHKCLFDWEHLQDCLQQAGFRDITRLNVDPLKRRQHYPNLGARALK